MFINYFVIRYILFLVLPAIKKNQSLLKARLSKHIRLRELERKLPQVAQCAVASFHQQSMPLSITSCKLN